MDLAYHSVQAERAAAADERHPTVDHIVHGVEHVNPAHRHLRVRESLFQVIV